MTVDEAKHKMDFLKKAYQKLIDEKVDSGKLIGDGVMGEWKAETPIDEAYKSMIEALEIAIKVLEQTMWIPCSERLPEVRDDKYGDTSDDVLICVMDEDGYYSISTGFYGYYPNNGSYQGWWSVWTDGCDKLYSKDKVIAWMPLPQSYEVESEEAE